MESLDKRNGKFKNLLRISEQIKCFTSYDSLHETPNRWMNIKEYLDWLNFQCYPDNHHSVINT